MFGEDTPFQKTTATSHLSGLRCEVYLSIAKDGIKPDGRKQSIAAGSEHLTDFRMIVSYSKYALTKGYNVIKILRSYLV